METIVFFDLETGGLRHSHPIIQAAFVAVNARTLKELGTLEMKLKFVESDCSPEALQKNSYERDSRLWKTHGIEPHTAAERIEYFLREHATVPRKSKAGRVYHVAQLAAHNAAFDGPFLFSWWQKQRREDPRLFLPASRRVLCTFQRACWMFSEDQLLSPPPDYTLSTLCRYFEIPLGAEAHDAFSDVRATVELYRAMCGHQRLRVAA